MRRKSPLRLAAMMALAIIILIGSNNFLIHLSPSVAVGAVDAEDPPPIPQKVFCNNTFEGLPQNQTPVGWTVNPDTAGNFTVENETVYRGNNSAKFVDYSNTAVVTAFSYFSQQNDTIVVSFSVKMPYNTGIYTGLEVSVDDGNFNGSNIIFNDNAIQYFDGAKGLQTLRSSYVANRWYGIKFIMDIPLHVYNIHIDDHLEATNARFNGTVTSIQRIALTESDTSDGSPAYPGVLLPLAYVDDILGIQGLNVPSDFPTIQAAVNAASPGDTIVLNGSRVYFENVVVPPNKSGITLEGQDVRSTIIDGKFNITAPFCVSLKGCSNVTICGLTLRNSYKSGAQIDITGNGSNVFANVIIAGLGSGIKIAGWNTTITDNLIQDNPIGIDLVSGQGNFVQNNTILNNTVVGLQCEKHASNNLIYGNRFVKNYLQAQDKGTSNRWDDGYPYFPINMTGGGNYWSDFASCTDVRSGPNQDQGLNCTLPLPDGICDQPYLLNLSSADHYPLFLIQSVAQNPPLVHANCALQVFDKSVEYNITVVVTVTTVKFVTVANATLYVEYTSGNRTTRGNIAGQISGNQLTFNISGQPYNTTIRYNVSVLADGASWLNSTNYPIPFPYFVDDMTPPIIVNVGYAPIAVNETQLVMVFATVNDGNANASGVYKVFVSYVVNITVWTAEMAWIGDDNYTATIPRQPGGTTLNFNVTAIDKAGNQGGPGTNSTYVKRLAQMLVQPISPAPASPIPFDPCSLDKGAVSGDQTFSVSFSVNNTAGANDESLIWNLTRIKDGPWLTSINATNGVVVGSQAVVVTVSIDTHKCTYPGLYIAEIALNASGTVSQWAVIITFTVKTIIVDDSWTSSQWPNRVDVGTTQIVAFHAEWAINCSDATGGTITINSSSTPVMPVNATGWGTFSVNSSSPAKTTFTVVGVKFDFVTSFAQRAPSPIVAWDRVKIVLSMANNYVDVDSAANISWNGSYELDGRSFKGAVLFNDSLTRDHVDEATITTSQIINYELTTNPMLNVTVFESNSIDVIWDEIRIIQGGVSNTHASSGQKENVWFIAIYERENTLFRGENGTMFLNVTTGQDITKVPLAYSFDDIWDWQKDFNYTSGTVNFQVSEVEDHVHHLTKIKDGIGQLNITWGETVRPWWEAWWPTSSNTAITSQSDTTPIVQPVQTESSNAYIAWATVLAAIVAMGSVLALLLVMGSRNKSKSSTVRKKKAQANENVNKSTSKR